MRKKKYVENIKEIETGNLFKKINLYKHKKYLIKVYFQLKEIIIEIH